MQSDLLISYFECLADPTRLRILRLLEKHELGVTELVDALQLPQSTISRHLKLLADQNWLASRRSGTSHLSVMLPAELTDTQQRLWAIAKAESSAWPVVRQDELRLDRRLRQRSDESKKFFTGAAAQWDSIRSQYYGGDLGLTGVLALIPADHVIADLGCGTGQLLAQLAPHVRQVIGVDNTPAMIEAAEHRTRDFDNVTIKSGELEALPLESKTVNAAVMTLALSYVAEPLAVLREMHRILKPGGRAVVIDIMTHDRDDFRREMGQTRLGFSGEELTELLKDAGFAKAVATPVATAQNARGPALILATAGLVKVG